MKKQIIGLYLLLVCMSAAPLLVAAQGTVQSAMELDSAITGIARKIQQEVPGNAVIAVKRFSSESAELSQYISSNLETALRSGGFTMAMRDSDTSKLLDEERDYQYNSGNVSDDRLVELGRHVGAQYLVYGYFEQLGSYLSLYARVVNVETAEAPVIETFAINPSEKLNQLLGGARQLQSANDYIEEIARCRAKLFSIQRERDNEITKVSSSIQTKYQMEINTVNKWEKDPWEKASEFNDRKSKEIGRLESERDNIVSGEKERISIQYNNMIRSVELSEREIKSKLEQTKFTLVGAAQVQALIGSFDAEAQHWPVSIKSLDEQIPYRVSAQLAINSADRESEYRAIEEAKASGHIAGEITYSIMPHSNDNDFDVIVLGYRVYNTETGSSYLNKTVNAPVGTTRAATKLTKPSSATSGGSKKKITAAPANDSTATSSSTRRAGGDSEAKDVSAGTKLAKADHPRVSDAFGIGYFYMFGNDVTDNTMGVKLNAFNMYKGHFFIDWLNVAFGMSPSVFLGGGSDTGFIEATADAGVWWHLFAPLFVFIKGGAGMFYFSYSDEWAYDEWSTFGFSAKIGAGLELKVNNHIKFSASYDLRFLLGERCFSTDSVSIGIGFGKPVHK